MLSKGWQLLTGLLLLEAQGGGARARSAVGRGSLREEGFLLGFEVQAGGGAPTAPVQRGEGLCRPRPGVAAPSMPTARPVQP